MTFDQIQYFIAIAECNTYFDARRTKYLAVCTFKTDHKTRERTWRRPARPFPTQGLPSPPPEKPFTRTPWPFAGSMRS